MIGIVLVLRVYFGGVYDQYETLALSVNVASSKSTKKIKHRLELLEEGRKECELRFVLYIESNVILFN